MRSVAHACLTSRLPRAPQEPAERPAGNEPGAPHRADRDGQHIPLPDQQHRRGGYPGARQAEGLELTFFNTLSVPITII